MIRINHIIVQLYRWRLRHISEQTLIILLSILVGFLSGMAAVLIKNAVRFTHQTVSSIVSHEGHNTIYVALPLLGILITILFVRYLTPSSVYNFQLARRKELLTHDKDTNVLRMLEVRKLIENDFEVLSPEATLGDLTKAIERNHRNLFPIVDKEGKMAGMLKMDDVRHLIFKRDLYDTLMLKDLMYMPEEYIHPDDSMEMLARKFEKTDRFNIAVIEKDGTYLGFISRARVFSKYRKQIVDVSHV